MWWLFRGKVKSAVNLEPRRFAALHLNINKKYAEPIARRFHSWFSVNNWTFAALHLKNDMIM